jgi:hypothetical protein
MNAPCTHCGMPLETAWSFCPRCGLTIPLKSGPHSDREAHAKSSVPGAFGGLVFGLVAAPALIIFGTLLCLTGLGAFLGVPMILGGVLAPLAGPLFGIGEHAVRCPNCHTREITIADSKLHYCPNCDKEFALGDHHAAQAG